jgi:hypothetical protein
MKTEVGSMVISWRPQHEVHPGRAPAPDFLAFDAGKVIGRMFQMTRRDRADRWFWTVIATGAGALVEPPSGVEERQEAAAQAFAEAYRRLTLPCATDRSPEAGCAPDRSLPIWGQMQAGLAPSAREHDHDPDGL